MVKPTPCINGALCSYMQESDILNLLQSVTWQYFGRIYDYGTVINIDAPKASYYYGGEDVVPSSELFYYVGGSCGCY